MKAYVYSLDGKKGAVQVDLPPQFSEGYRPDLIKRSVLAMQSRKRVPYGPRPDAGLRTSARHIARRSIYGSLANRGIARMKRIVIGTGYLAGTGRVAPHAIKGRKAHAPKTEKDYSHDVNDNERRAAIRSAIAATADKDLVARRGHKTGELVKFPIVCEDKIESIDKTKDVLKALEALGFSDDIDRTSKRKVRAGKGTMRGRVYRIKTGPLVVVANNKGVNSTVANIPGVDVIEVRNLNAEVLAPGTHAGRLTVWTKSAIEMLGNDKLFM